MLEIILQYSVSFLILWFILLKYCTNPVRRCTSRFCLNNKIALITGGSKGLGHELALALASRGCKVIVTCRSNMDEVKESIIKNTRNPNIDVKYLDLNCLESIRTFAKDLNESIDRIDILINNAGITGSWDYTKDNIHIIMQTNHFGPFLLNHLLIDLLKKSTSCRVIFVSSLMAIFSNLSLDNLNPVNIPVERQTFFESCKLYCNSKLCNIITMQIFAKKLEKFNITYNAIHPGLINTDIFRNHTSIPGFLMDLYYKCFINLVGKSCDEGIQAILNCAISKEFEGVTGEFLWDLGKLVKPFKANNKEFSNQIWKASEEFVKLQLDEKI